MLNVVALNGRLTANVNKGTFTNKNGKEMAYARFSLAVDRDYTNAQGERPSDFINCVLISNPKYIDALANNTTKGSLISVHGRIQSNNYTDKDGNKRYSTEVNVDTFNFLESKEVTDARRAKNGSTASTNKTTTNAKQETKDSAKKTEDPFADSGKDIDISDDDLPF